MCFTFEKNNKKTKKPVNSIWHDGPQKGFWPLCPNAWEEEAETWWLLILIYLASKKLTFGSLGYPVLP